VLLCDDPDAPAGTWRHWATYDVASDRAELAEAASRVGGGEGLKQAINDFGRPGYGGLRPAATDLITITFDCLRSRSTACR
jgi:phosphatidylethanolamine-binding protein (PEBP) family uncharacterized protein